MRIFLGVVLAILVIGILALEIINSASSTKTETALFGVMQFLFSIGFAWIISNSISKADFLEQQKRFAMSAYRRIREIESKSGRLTVRLRSARGMEDASALQRELEVAFVIAEDICETAESSKVDWADVIGDKIEKIEEIDSLVSRRSELVLRVDERHNTDPSLEEKLSDVEKQLENLTTSLPSNWRMLASKQNEREDPYNVALKKIKENGYLGLHGFYKINMSSDPDEFELEVGEVLDVAIEDHGSRVGALIARNSDGIVIGSFLNDLGGSFDDFTGAVCYVIGKSNFKVIVIKVNPRPSPEGRMNFFVRPLDD